MAEILKKPNADFEWRNSAPPLPQFGKGSDALQLMLHIILLLIREKVIIKE